MEIPTIPNNFILCFFSSFTLLPFFPFLPSFLQGLAMSPSWTWTPRLKWFSCLRLVSGWIVSTHPVVLSFKNLTTVQVKTCGFQGMFRFSPFPPALRKIFRQKFPVTVKFDSDCFFPLSHFVSLSLIFSFLDIYSRTQLGVLSYCSFFHIKIREN